MLFAEKIMSLSNTYQFFDSSIPAQFLRTVLYGAIACEDAQVLGLTLLLLCEHLHNS